MAQVKCNVGPTGSAIVFSVGGGAVQWLEETARTADEVLGNVFASLGRPDTQMRQAHRCSLAISMRGRNCRRTSLAALIPVSSPM